MSGLYDIATGAPRFVHESHADNVITVTTSKSGDLLVSVSDEQAVDSYNSVFECTISMSRRVAEDLHKFLTAYLAEGEGK